MYGGGMGELGVGRGQIELLAALFHADAPNDVAPSAYNEDDPPGGLPASPLDAAPRGHRLPLGGVAVPAVLQLDDPAAGGGAGDQVELVGLGDAVEQPGALARNVGEHAQLELVDQVEPHERPPEADAAPDHDVAVAALPELVDLFCRVTGGDGGVGPVGRLQGPGEDDLAPGVQDVGERVVGGRCRHGPRRCPRRRCGP